MASSKDVAWWIDSIDHKITPDVLDALGAYTGLERSKIPAHIYTIRDRAWAIKAYPCTGIGAFFTPSISRHPNYSDIVSRIKGGAALLDLGCYMGTDLRQLSMDGCPQDKLYGSDIANLWDLGCELYCDKGRFHAKFLQSDIFKPSTELLALTGSMDIISTTHFFHNWTSEQQLEASCAVARLTKPGSTVIGFQAGNYRDDGSGDILPTLKLHSIESFARLWDEVGKATGTQWRTEATMRSWESMGYCKEETAYIGADAGILQFIVSRIS